MGIPGLMSYINQRSDKFLRNYELHDTHLIIDGYCIMFELYTLDNLSCSYGGEYGKYASYVNLFFDELQTCKVTPIVILDGGAEDKKLKTICKRHNERIRKIAVSTASNEQRIMPLLITEVFKYIIKQRNIKCIMSLFEADDHIASLANILNCPVLSFDSDFFVYDVQYIPFNTLQFGVYEFSARGGFAKHCKIFRTEFLLEDFPNMNVNVLPLASILLGNDYISSNVFKNFFCTLEVPWNLKEAFEKKRSHLRIEIIFRWLEQHSLNSAISLIISKLDQDKRQRVIEIIEIILNGYLNVSPIMLESLGYTPKDINIMMEKITNKPFEFEKVTNLLEQNDTNSDKAHSILDLDDNLLSSEEETYSIIKPGTENEVIIKIAPTWFIDAFRTAYFPGSFIDILFRQLIFVADQMEDFSKSPSINISLKIISVIFKLLSNGTTNAKILKYIGRGKNNSIETFELKCNNVKLFNDIPTLAELKDLPKATKKYILNCTLGVSDKLILFPPEWRLYVAAIIYWLVEADKNSVTKYHLYSIVFLLVFHVIKKVLKYHSYFQKKINFSKNQEVAECTLSPSVPVVNALWSVKEDDCKKAYLFFKSKMDLNSQNYDISLIHSYSLFQNTLKYTIYLNALLDTPYLSTNIGDFYSGSLIYNIFRDLRPHKMLNQHVCHIFNDAPSILQLFISISSTIQSMQQPI